MAEVWNNALFLHMGPGLNCSVERKLLSPHFKNVHFWDQPFIRTSSNSFGKLVQETANEVVRLSDQLGQPIQIIAHSFSGHLFEHLIEKHPERIAHATLYSTGYDILGGYFQLLKVMGKSPSSSPQLRAEISEFLSHPRINIPPKDQLQSCLEVITKDPLFFRFYFFKLEMFKTYWRIAEQSPAIDLETFTFVLNDFFDNYFGRDFSFEGSQEIKMVFGNKDPLLIPGTEASWKKRFPKAQFITMADAGHFTHLEAYL